MGIYVEGGYDGANPQEASAIEQRGDGHYRVHPFSEDGDANYKFALNVRVTNTSEAVAQLTIEVEWADQVYMDDRSYVYVGNGDRWELAIAHVSGSVATFRRDIPPGVSYMGLSPAYGLARFQDYALGLDGSVFRRRLIGRSEQNREIEVFQVGEGQKPILVVTRFHPYETAGSFCAEGLLNWLGTDGAEQACLRRAFSFVVVPMPNPDGVYQGLCKRTGLTGVDLSHDGAYGQDGAARALLGLMEELRPAGLLDIHGWMYYNEDGLNYVSERHRERFVAELSAHPLFLGNVWRGSRVGSRPNAGCLREHCHRMYGTEALVLSYRWPGRTVLQMREIGAATLRAFCAYR